MTDATIKAVLGPTNTGKTHLAIERMCGHSSGAIGFPLRLLAREVYDRVVAIRGDKAVALITGEERIEPPDARYFLCTAEAMPRGGGGPNGPLAFVALDEAQLAADRERGHVFTDHLLNTRGREETMLLGASTLEPIVRALVPKAEIVTRPRFSTLTHISPRKLSRLPPRSAIVAFSAEQVYAVAEMLRRFRGGAAVVMGALSPETRNKQVALFQSGEVDYIVATDAIGMGLNLDVTHVAFAGLTKFDGQRQRRLIAAEMAQIAGRAGRHHRDGTFGTLAGQGQSPEFTEEEVYAIEEHRFAPLTKLFWREPEPRYDSIATLIEDLEAVPPEPELVRAPEATDLAVLKRLAEDGSVNDVKVPGQVRRLWEACRLPDFRQHGPETHARFVARLWRDLRGGYLGADFVAARIADLDRTQGDIDTLQGRIAAIRSWAYICQRPDWVLARDEMAARARSVEARLSDALHARLTERFVNRRTAILMKNLGQDPALLPVTLAEDGTVAVEEEPIGRVEGFRFVVDHRANHADHRLLLSAAEKALPRLLGERAQALAAGGFAGVTLDEGAVRWNGSDIAHLEPAQLATSPRIVPTREVTALSEPEKGAFMAALNAWVAAQLAPLEPLAKLEAASRDPAAGSEARALLLNLIDGHGYATRERTGIEHLPRESRPFLRKLGVVFGALDVFAPALLKPAARAAFHASGADRRALEEAMRSVIPGGRRLPAGYRPAGEQAVRVDVAEKLLRTAHETRAKAARRYFVLDPALAISTGLTEDSWKRLMGAAGFKWQSGRKLAEGALGPPAPDRWSWHPGANRNAGSSWDGSKAKAGKPTGNRPKGPRREKPAPAVPRPGNAFAALADLIGK
ncbi:helicase-related protein [Tsuneonella mangrovi]|uniref:helicase-related protein n=1 Tax=Tsuneonella mangrovi TaxID=1982042 RepID=UPI000BA28C0A|nr:helicase-related protein [Tsuneonella mangrovi]